MIPVRPIRASVVAAVLLATGLPSAVVATAADGDAPLPPTPTPGSWRRLLSSPKPHGSRTGDLW